jgi:hypothetical protein
LTDDNRQRSSLQTTTPSVTHFNRRWNMWAFVILIAVMLIAAL